MFVSIKHPLSTIVSPPRACLVVVSRGHDCKVFADYKVIAK